MRVRLCWGSVWGLQRGGGVWDPGGPEVGGRGQRVGAGQGQVVWAGSGARGLLRWGWGPPCPSPLPSPAALRGLHKGQAGGGDAGLPSGEPASWAQASGGQLQVSLCACSERAASSVPLSVSAFLWPSFPVSCLDLCLTCCSL